MAQRQSEALAKTLELLVRAPALPDFVRALMRAITAQCGGLWTTFWLMDEHGDGRRTWIQWRDEAVGEKVEVFARKHPLLMRRLGSVYRDLIRADGVTLLVPVEDSRVPRLIRGFYRKIGATGALLVPLKLGRQLLGWITHQRGDAAIAPEQVAFIEGMTQQAALAFYLTRLSDAKHDAECALDEERQAREHEQELLAVRRLLHITTHDPADRLGAVLRGSLENVAELLRGHWAVLWRNNDAGGFAVPAWIGAPGDCARVSMEEGLKIAAACRQTHRMRFEKWRAAGEVRAECAGSRRMRDLLARMGAPPPAERGAKLVHVPLWFDDESRAFMLVLTENFPEEASERHVAVKALAAQAALALELDEMSSVQRSAALAEERNRIARDLHDLLAQSFTGIVLQVEATSAECPGMPEVVAARLEKIRAHAARSAEELRRTLSMLRPTALDQCTLPDALAMLARETESRSGVKVEIRNRAEPLALPMRTEQHLYAIVSEALQNALSHAWPSLISISLKVLRGRLVVSVVNDGVLPAEPARSRPGGHGHGLSNIRERVLQMGAHFSLRTFRRLTRLEVTIPLESEQNG